MLFCKHLATFSAKKKVIPNEHRKSIRKLNKKPRKEFQNIFPYKRTMDRIDIIIQNITYLKMPNVSLNGNVIVSLINPLPFGKA
jgi:hypothetical protein